MKLIDMHTHIWFTKDIESEKRLLLQTIEKYGIDMAFVSGLKTYFSTEEEVSYINDVICMYAKESADVIKGYAYVCPEHRNALDVVKRGIEEQNMVGVKIWVSEYCDSDIVSPLAEKIIDYNVPLLIHSSKKSTSQVAKENTSVNIRNLALRYPELKIIMAHIDGNCYNGVQIVRELKNVWVDVSGSSNRTNEIEYAVENLGDDRILFGSDLTGCSFAIPYGKVMEAEVSDLVKEKIFYKNTLKLFDRDFKIR